MKVLIFLFSVTLATSSMANAGFPKDLFKDGVFKRPDIFSPVSGGHVVGGLVASTTVSFVFYQQEGSYHFELLDLIVQKTLDAQSVDALHGWSVQKASDNTMALCLRFYSFSKLLDFQKEVADSARNVKIKGSMVEIEPNWVCSE